MKRLLGILTLAIAATALLCQSANADWFRHRGDPAVKAAGITVGAAATVGYFALNDWKLGGGWNTKRSTGLTSGGAFMLTTIGCVALSPMVATACARRPLTHREAHVLAGSCIVPIIGGLLVNAVWDAHPEWDRFDAVAAAPAPAPRRAHRHRR